MEIRELQLYKLEMLKDFKAFCNENNLTYSLTYGTLLGAIRHKGFIPWDDDVDIQMPLKDYRKFLKIGKKKLNKKYFIQNYKTDPKFPLMFTQIRVNGTTSMPVKSKNLDIHWGICIDVFPTIKLWDKGILKKTQKRLIRLVYSLLSTDAINANNLQCEGSQVMINRLPRRFRHLLADLGLALAFSNHQKNSKCKALASTNLKPYGTSDEWTDLIPWTFEDCIFPIPRDYDSILTQMYKDYMQLPPVEKRGGHEIQLGEQIVDLFRDYQEYKRDEN